MPIGDDFSVFLSKLLQYKHSNKNMFEFVEHNYIPFLFKR